MSSAPTTAPAAPPRPAKPWRRLLAALAVALVILVLLRTFVGRSYRVTTASMEPTILGQDGDDFPGESVLVTYGVGELERFDLVVVDRGGDAPFVKRIVGLPGERVRLLDGDVLVGGERLAPDAPRPAPVELFDSRRDDVTEHFHFRQAPEGAWKLGEDGTLTLSGDQVQPGSEVGMLLLHKELRDGYRRHDGSLDPGVHPVGDCRLEVSFVLEDPGAVLRARLVEEGDLFELTIGAADEQGLRAVVLRRDPGGEVLAQVSFPWSDQGIYGLTFENRDNHVEAVLLHGLAGSSEEVLRVTATYDNNRLYHGILPDDRTSVAPRVAVGGEGGDLRIVHIRVLRDLHFLPIGTHAVGEALDLGPGEYFLLGDNSADSADGRRWGPTPVAGLVGRPLAVVAPSERWRVLR